MDKSLDQKLKRIHADPHGCKDFILADAKDADMALAIGAPGRSPEAHSGELQHRTLAEYRTRYAQYHRDPDVQALHLALPIIPLVDDHELADGAWAGGSDAHDPAEHGPWEDRREDAFRAREEWLPVRRPDPAWHRAHFTDPRALVPDSLMPSFAFLSERDQDDLAAYLVSLDRSAPLPEAPLPKK